MPVGGEKVKQDDDGKKHSKSNSRECGFLMTDQGTCCVAKYDYKAGKDNEI